MRHKRYNNNNIIIIVYSIDSLDYTHVNNARKTVEIKIY